MADCEPSINTLHKGVKVLKENLSEDKKKQHVKQARAYRNIKDAMSEHGNELLAETDVYAAADSMEILRDAFNYFLERRSWKSALTALGGLERVHKMGVEAMCDLIEHHLEHAGMAVKPKRTQVDLTTESANDARARLAAALQNRDLMKSIGEYEEIQPVEARAVREIRSVFECLGGDGFQLGKPRHREIKANLEALAVPANKVVRTAKVGSGTYFNLVKAPIKTGYPHLDSFGEARRHVAHGAIDGYYRAVRSDRKKRNAKKEKNIAKMAVGGDDSNDADAAARDAVRCLEHAMVVVAGEKSIHRTVVAPSLIQQDEEAEGEVEISPLYKKACVTVYSFVAGSVVDRALDIVETVFLKECGIGQSSGAAKEDSSTPPLSVRSAASGAAAGLRMLDGVRMLGPSLAKLCDLQIDGKKSGGGSDMAVASTLCIAIHRTTVKNSARTLENLGKAIQDDSNPGATDARISSLTSDVVRAIRLISPYVSAYKSVTKRRALPWDPKIGEDAGELDSYIRFLMTRLLGNLQQKSLNYSKHNEEHFVAKGFIFMVNNTSYLLKQLGPLPETHHNRENDDAENYRIESPWFSDKTEKILENEKQKYFSMWEELNKFLSSVDNNALEYQKDNVLSLDSGRVIKSRFSGFNENFERMYEFHKNLSVADEHLRASMITGVKQVFLPKYKNFYDKFSKVQFSKKNMEQYLKYQPQKIDSMLNTLYV